MAQNKPEDPLADLKAEKKALDTKLAAAEKAGNQHDKDFIRQQLIANQQAQSAIMAMQRHITPMPLAERHDYDVPYTWPYFKVHYLPTIVGTGGMSGAALLWGLPRTQAIAVGCATFMGQIMWG